MTAPPSLQADLLDFAAPNEKAGFRLQRLELYNWGTFDGRVWPLHTGGETSLLTGDIGSGKSTVVDALTTLLVAPQKLTYNKAAGAEARERTVRSYVLGHYKAERSETGSGAKPVSLRDANSYSVLLAHFFNQGYEQHVTLAQVFWTRELEGQPARFFVVADRHLTIAEHFSDFADIGALKKRLRGLTKEVHDSFPGYQAAFTKRFGIQNDQALELFHQTVSMKSVGNLTDFVRQHMLQPFPVDERIEALVRHVDDLTRAHEAVLRAKAQLERLVPLVADCDQYQALEAQVHEARACREALRAWFAARRLGLLKASLEELDAKYRGLSLEAEQLDAAQRGLGEQRDAKRLDIHQSGGERLERVRAEMAAKAREKDDRQRRAAGYDANARLANLPAAPDGPSFLANQRALEALGPETDERLAALHVEEVASGVRFADLRKRQEELATEVESLRKRRSSIPSQLLALRAQLCAALDLPEEDLPFAGELLQVHEDERAWEGAIERVLHGFGTSLLVPDEHYGRVSLWADKTNLGGRLVYFRVRDAKQARPPAQEPTSLVRKLTLKHDSPLSEWLEGELARRFNLVCCDSIDQFRREPHALTRAGQVKQGGVQHTKDDRHRVDDRTRFVLGWSNQEKLAVMGRELAAAQAQVQQVASALAAFTARRRALEALRDAARALSAQTSFADIDWRSVVLDLERLAGELRELEASSDLLRTLEAQLRDLEAELAACERRLKDARDRASRLDERRKALSAQLTGTQAVVDATTAEEASRFARLQELNGHSPEAKPFTLDSADAAERDFRSRLQAQIDAEDQRLGRLRERIVKAMQDYRGAYPVETREADASLAAAGEFRKMLATLQTDDLPRFEARFKELLNENTIREIANFQSQLGREQQDIRERIELINKSLREINFNEGRFIELEAVRAVDAEVRDFQQDLKACTEGTLLGSSDDSYSEAKFLQVKRIIERFRGREGFADLDRKWTAKVTDVRNWFAFSVSERWREDGREHEHYTDSGGKSGGQKEKLAYTVLAASLAYQFGLEWGETRSRSFRFVVIDEAFGRGSDESAAYGLELFKRLNLQLLVVTPLQKIHVIEPYVANVGFVHNADGERSLLRNLSIEEYRAEKAMRGP